jgi:predicted TIM-barrel fold metal-dependent hydrolase
MSYQIIDVDTHITEPADLWTSRVASRHRDHVPHVRRVDGRDLWFLEGEQIAIVGGTAPAGWTRPMPEFPPGYDHVLRAAFDPKARLALMDQRGVWAEVLYPNVGGFAGQRFLSLPDAELKLECVRAYNDFQRDWTSAAPERLIPTTATPFWDVQACVREVERCARLGFRAVNFTGEPQVFGLPYLGDRHWDPLWSAICDHAMVLSFHIGSGSFDWDDKRVAAHGFAEEYALQSVALFTRNGLQICDLLLSGVLPRYPGLRVVSVESGIGWMPFMFEALDNQFREGGGYNERPEFTQPPSQYFRDQVYSTFWFEEAGTALIGTQIPADNVMFETDFPHPTCLYDNVEEKLAASIAHLSADVRRKVLWDNAARVYGIQGPPAISSRN